ncbi:MAG: exosortase/archaeosortase family protein [Verrucomicrobiales bacterium]|nr:exosortase/archaeosortase family protein [Verrucomicrobiales bacterium]
MTPLRLDKISIPIFLGLLWAQLFHALHPTWVHGQYYDYGWIVAPVTAWFFWRRWTGFDTPPILAHRQKMTLLTAVFGIIILAIFLVLARTMERFDPIWRIPLILHGAVVFATTHLTLWLVYGKRTSLTFLPLVLFAMTAVPWPTQVENSLIGELTERLLAVSAPLSRLIGIPVELSGSALIADGRVIQIDEGCSGIRSFQSLIMAGLFVGEFVFLRNWFRVALVVIAMISGFLTNTLRSIVLTWIFFKDGEIAFDRAHDMVGFLAFGLAAGLLLLSGHYLEGKSFQGSQRKPPGSASTSA